MASLPAYRLSAAVEPFYAGGALSLLPDGRVACACGDEVKVRDDGGKSAKRRKTCAAGSFFLLP